MDSPLSDHPDVLYDRWCASLLEDQTVLDQEKDTVRLPDDRNHLPSYQRVHRKKYRRILLDPYLLAVFTLPSVLYRRRLMLHVSQLGRHEQDALGKQNLPRLHAHRHMDSVCADLHNQAM